jgi:hypothetical protein
MSFRGLAALAIRLSWTRCKRSECSCSDTLSLRIIILTKGSCSRLANVSVLIVVVHITVTIPFERRRILLTSTHQSGNELCLSIGVNFTIVRESMTHCCEDVAEWRQYLNAQSSALLELRDVIEVTARDLIVCLAQTPPTGRFAPIRGGQRALPGVATDIASAVICFADGRGLPAP